MALTSLFLSASHLHPFTELVLDRQGPNLLLVRAIRPNDERLVPRTLNLENIAHPRQICTYVIHHVLKKRTTVMSK